MNAQEAVEQSSKQHAQIVEGAKLNMAFKTDGGQVIAESIVEAVAKKVEDMLWQRSLGDEEALKRLYEIRGILDVAEGMGDAITLAVSAVSRNAVQSRLRVQTRRQSHEEERA